MRRATKMVGFLLAGSVVNCSTGRPAPDPALIGSWNVADSSGGMIQFGFRILEESHDGIVTGVIQRVFAGNVGMDVSRFDRLRGEVDGRRVTLRADHADSSSSLLFEFERTAEGLRVVAITLGSESLVGIPNTWVAWRE